MSKSRVLFYLLLAFILGVSLCSFFEIEQFLFAILLWALIILFIFYKNPTAAIIAFSLGFFALGVFTTSSSLKIANSHVYLDKIYEGEAIIIKTSDSAFGQNVIAEFQQLSFENQKINVLMSLPKYPEHKYGDEIQLTCTLKTIENKDESFDYRMYMAKEKVYYMCEKPKIKIIDENRGDFFYQKILEIRSSFEEKILQLIPQPEGALADGLLFGGNAGLSKEIQNDFSRTGMTHIVAVSGYNVTIIAEYLIMLGIMLGLWRKQAIWFALAGIFLFVIMSGLPASAVRAGVMGGILLWAMKNGRIAQAQNAIIFAAAIMLFINPLLLRYDVGFQLSFLATLGIVTTSPFWEKSFIKSHKALGISETIAMSISAQIFVLPIIAFNFQNVSLISLLANIFILPIIPASMLLVFLTSLFSFLISPVAQIIAWIAYVPLFYELNLIHLLSQFPWASMQIENFSIFEMFIYYLIIFLMIIWKSHQSFAINNQK